MINSDVSVIPTTISATTRLARAAQLTENCGIFYGASNAVSNSIVPQNYKNIL